MAGTRPDSIFTKIYNLLHPSSQKYVTSSDMTTAADITTAPTTGLKIMADSILVSAAVDMEFQIVEETSGTVLSAAFVPAYGSAYFYLVKAAVANKKLQGKASVAGNVRITTNYHSEA